MYETKKKTRTLSDGTEVRTFTREVVSANILEVEAGTTGYMGGDAGHGGRTYFRIKDLGSTDMQVLTNPDVYGNAELEVCLGGDCELGTIIRALKFITKVLEEEKDGVRD